MGYQIATMVRPNNLQNASKTLSKTLLRPAKLHPLNTTSSQLRHPYSNLLRHQIPPPLQLHNQQRQTTTNPSSTPTAQPTTPKPTSVPLSQPTTTNSSSTPTTQPTTPNPTSVHLSPTTANPSSTPTAQPTTPKPTSVPTSQPTSNPSSIPSAQPTMSNPTSFCTSEPMTTNPSSTPTAQPMTPKPTYVPTSPPTANQSLLHSDCSTNNAKAHSPCPLHRHHQLLQNLHWVQVQRHQHLNQ